jgi:prophage regulatory protein
MSNETEEQRAEAGGRPIHGSTFLRLEAVIERTGLSRATLWRLEKEGQFPKRRRLSPGRVAWLREEVDTWIQSRPA